MKRISYYLTTLCSMLALAFTPACTDDIDLPVPAREEIPEGITLRIPDPGMAASLTRSEAELTDAEKQISSLYLIAFPSTTDDDRSPIIEDLLTSDKVTDGGGYTHDGQTGTGISDVTTSSTGYHSYTVTDLFKDSDGKLMTGNWTIYVAANIDPYLTDFTSLSAANPATEAALKALKLSFVDGDSNRMYTYGPSKGLPMVCLANDVIIRDGKTDTSTPGGTLNVTNSAQSIIHADMQFLVAKVRCTFLFDNESFSKNVFDGKSLQVTGASVKNNYQSPYTLDGTLNSKSTIPPTPWSIRHDDQTKKYLECEYPAEGSFPYFSSTIPGGGDTYTFVDLKKLEFAATSPYNPRAYQVTMYLPANPQETQTELVFVAQEKHKEGSNIKAGVDITYSIPLVPTTPSTRLEAGKAYDIVAKVTGVEKVNTMVQVQSFTPKSLVYKLIPARYLKVDQTVVDMIAGKDVEIVYETNAETIEIDGPTYGGKQLYKLTRAANGKLYIGVNPEISVDLYAGINSAIAATDYDKKYHQFYIVAGDIRKKIDIKDLTLQRFMTVDQTKIIIDARDKISGGEYSGDFTIEIETNLDKVYLSTDNWGTVTSGKSSCLKLTNETNGSAIWTSGTNAKETATITGGQIKDGKMTLNIHFDNVNTNNETFWSTPKTLKFYVSCDNKKKDENGNDVDIPTTDPSYIGMREVTVEIYPNTDNYTIYLMPPDDWDVNSTSAAKNPHIYVYQVLELPMGLSNANFSSKPVGYYIKYNNVVKGYANAALEFNFSGYIAFKGWDAPGNITVLDNLSKGSLHWGFYIYDNADEDGDWNPSKDTYQNHYYTNVDFNAAHRALGICGDCPKNGNGYPGIGMYKVKDSDSDPNKGWWKYELSSLATPGKAVMIFNGGHTSDDTHRFPSASKVGLPLFDFPNRIGYLNLKDGSTVFTPTANGVVAESRVYFDNTANWDNLHAYIWRWKGNDLMMYKNESWPGVELSYDATKKLYYLDIDDDSYNGTNIIFNNGKKDGEAGKAQTADLTLTFGQKYNAAGSVGGGGSGTVYRFTWKKDDGYGNKRTKMIISKNNTETQYKYTGQDPDDSNNWYFDYEASSDSEEFWISHCDDNGNNKYPGTYWKVQDKRGSKISGKTYSYKIHMNQE